ncbi:MAG TPA: DNA replication/repair protein RecF [Candidatus Dormibacteraeota bacterium]|nr:DNA replication/repair protein RecF [Candidatus Dormibacteraeota bacterium]
MRLLELRLRNFRNYRSLELEPHPQLNLFLGRNGQGKTNLLESIAMLALSSSPRASRELELVGPLASEARIEAVVERPNRRIEIEMSIRVENGRGRRIIKIDGQNKPALDLPGIFRAVLFWPEDLNLIKAGPEHRRRFLNRMLVQIEPGYARALSSYRRALEQRNHLLRMVAAGQERSDALDPWDQQLAAYGDQIGQARAAAVEELIPRCLIRHLQISAEDSIDLKYKGPPQDLLSALQSARGEDLRRGSTSLGPHRDDLGICLDGREAAGFASQGQQRTIVVSLKLAESDVIEQRSGEDPVLLLDDVLSELDASRREALLTAVSQRGQVVITSVEAAPFPDQIVDRARVLNVREGTLIAYG